MRLIDDDQVALGQQEALHRRVEQQQGMVDNDNLGAARPLAHLAHVTRPKVWALPPGAQVTLCSDASAQIAGQGLGQQIEVAVPSAEVADERLHRRKGRVAYQLLERLLL